MYSKKYVMVSCPKCGVRYIDYILLGKKEPVLILVCPLCRHSIYMVD